MKKCLRCKVQQNEDEFRKFDKLLRHCKKCRGEVFKVDFFNWKGTVPDLPTEVLMWIGGFGEVQTWASMRLVNRNWGSLPVIPALGFRGYCSGILYGYLSRYHEPVINVQYGMSTDELLSLVDMKFHDAVLRVLRTKSFSKSSYQKILDKYLDIYPNRYTNFPNLDSSHYDIISILLKTYDLDVSDRGIIMWACKYGDPVLLKKILKNPTCNPENAVRPFSTCCRHGSEDCFDVLMDDGRFDPSIADNEALREAVVADSHNMIRKLLAVEKVDPSCKGNQCLQIAIVNKDTQLVKCLLEHPRVDPNNCLDHAVRAQALRAIGLLLATGKIRQPEIKRALIHSISQNLPAITKLLLPLVEPSADNHALTVAVSLDFGRNLHGMSAFKLFLEDKRVDVTCRDNQLLLDAVAQRSEPLVRILLDHGANVNVKKGEAMTKAIAMRSSGIIEAILERKEFQPRRNHLIQSILNHDIKLLRKFSTALDPSYDDNVCIKTAAKLGFDEGVEILIKDPRVDPRKAVLRATTLDTLNILLKDPRVDPSIRNSKVLVNAIERVCNEMVRRLIEDGRVDFAVQNNLPLTTAAARRHWDVVDCLLDKKGVDPTVDDYSTIRMACLYGQYDLVEKMLAHPKSNGLIHTFIDIQIAVQQKNARLFKDLVEMSGIELNIFDNWLLTVVTQVGGIGCTKVLLECPAVDPSVNSQKYFEDACSGGDADVVSEFLKHPSINPAKFGFRALDKAYSEGNFPVLNRLRIDRRCRGWSEPVDDFCSDCYNDPCICSQLDDDDADEDDHLFPHNGPQCHQQ